MYKRKQGALEPESYKHLVGHSGLILESTRSSWRAPWNIISSLLSASRASRLSFFPFRFSAALHPSLQQFQLYLSEHGNALRWWTRGERDGMIKHAIFLRKDCESLYPFPSYWLVFYGLIINDNFASLD